MKRYGRLAAAGAALLLCAPPSHGLEAKKSVYTRHVYSRCPPLKSPEPGVVEIRSCLGVGVNLFWTADDDGAVVSFGRAPIKESLDIAPFLEAGDTIEWRSTDASRGKPVAAIVRYGIGQRVGALKSFRLVVYRLEPSGRSCVMAVVNGPGANEKARAVADRDAAAFKCGSSKRLER
jgi:hypothetical protein